MIGIHPLAEDCSPPVNLDNSSSPEMMGSGLSYPRVKRLSIDQLELTRKIGRGWAVSLPEFEQGASITVELTAAQWVNRDDSLILDGEFGEISVAKGAELLRALSGIDLSQELTSDEDRWSWMQAAVVARIGLKQLSGIKRIGRPLSTGTTQPNQDKAHVAVCLTLRTQLHTVSTLARGNVAAWCGFFSQSGWYPLKQEQAALAEVPVSLSVKLGSHVLPAAALGRLGVGDILLPSQPLFGTSGEGLLHAGPWKLGVQYRPAGVLEVTQLEKSMMLDAQSNLGPDDLTQDDDSYLVDEDQERSIDEEILADESHELKLDDHNALPVTLDFNMGSVHMTVGDVRTLGVGSILTVTGGSPTLISIQSAGRTLGIGEAVDVDGQLGIRIAQWMVR